MWKVKAPKRVEVVPLLAAIKGQDGETIVHLDPEGRKSPAAAGILLVDIARHYARMFVQTGRASSEATALDEIRQLFDAEWDSPNDPGEGGIPS